MAIQRLDLTPTPHALGESLGSGLGRGLETLANSKMKQILKNSQDQQTAKGLEALGFSPDQSKAYAGFDPRILNTIVKQKGDEPNNQLYLDALNMGKAGQGYQTNNTNQNYATQNQIQHPNRSFGGYSQQQEPSGLGFNEPRAPLGLPIPPNLNFKQANNLMQVRQRQQASVNSQNAPFTTGLSKASNNLDEAMDYLLDLKKLNNTGNLMSGVAGHLPTFALNTDSQDFNTTADKYVDLSLSGQTGVPTGFKIKFKQGQKPNLFMTKEARERAIDKEIKKIQRLQQKAQLVNQVIQENGGEQPPNLEQIVYNRYEQLKKNQKEQDQPQGAPLVAQQQQSESPIGALTRNIVSAGVRAGEGALEQIPGIANLGLGAANFATGGAVPTYNQIREKAPFLPPAEFAPYVNEITNGYTAPRNEVEKFIHNIANFAGGVAALPVGWATKGLSFLTSPDKAAQIAKIALPFSRLPWKQALKLGAVGEFAGKAIESVGGGPLAQGLGKIASMMVASTPFGKGSMLKTAEDNYAVANKAAANETVNIAAAETKLRDLARDVSKGFDPNKRIIEGVIDESINSLNSHKIAGKPHQIPVNKLVDLKQQANKWYQATEFPRVQGEKHIPKDAKRIVGKIIDTFNQPIKEYGLKNPKFGEPYSLAEDLYKGVKDVDFINKFINENASKIGLKSSLGKALFYGSVGAGSIAAKSVPLALGLGVIPKASETLQLLVKHPSARKHYLNALQAAAQNNTAAFVREARIVDREAQRLG